MRACHAVPVNGDRTSDDVWGAAIAVEAALSLLLGLVLVFIWGLTGAGYFWPKWVIFALAVPLAIQLAVRLRAAGARRAPAGARPPWRGVGLGRGRARRGLRARRRRHVLAAVGGGHAWRSRFGAHAIVVAALPSLRPQERQLAARVDELTRTRARRPRRPGGRAAAHRARPARRRPGAARRAEHAARAAPRSASSDRPEVAELVRRGARGGGRGDRRAARPRPRHRAAGAGRPRPGGGGRGARAPRADPGHRRTRRSTRRPPPVVETAAYFVVAEALTNAAKHAGGAARDASSSPTHGGPARRRGRATTGRAAPTRPAPG